MLALDAPTEAIQMQAFNVGSNEQNYQIERLARVIASRIPGSEVDLIPDDPDKRTYHVNFDKITKTLGFHVDRDVPESAAEIAKALNDGSVADDIRTRTLDYYTYLLDAKKLLDGIVMDGRVL